MCGSIEKKYDDNISVEVILSRRYTSIDKTSHFSSSIPSISKENVVQCCSLCCQKIFFSCISSLFLTRCCKKQNVSSKLALLANRACTLEMLCASQKWFIDDHTHHRCLAIKTRSCTYSNIPFFIFRTQWYLSLVVFVLSGGLCASLDFLSKSIS